MTDYDFARFTRSAVAGAQLVKYGLRNRFGRDAITGEAPVIITTSSFEARYGTCWATLESLRRGTVRPARFFLWLDEGLAKKPLPAPLERLRAHGLEINFVPDIGPHKKYYYTAPIAAEMGLPFVTVDDDAIYPVDFLENLVAAHQAAPDQIACNRARTMVLTPAGAIAPYNDWPFCTNDQASRLTFFTGVGGVIYPPAFARLVAREADGFRGRCDRADDIWLNYLAAKHGFLARQRTTEAFSPASVFNTQKSGLWTTNADGGNDGQIGATYDAGALAALRAAVSAQTIRSAPAAV